MDISALASWIIVVAASAFVTSRVLEVLASISLEVSKRRAHKRRMAEHDRFVAARVAAREKVEAKLRLEGRWSNIEISEAMDAAGRVAAPGYRP